MHPHMQVTQGPSHDPSHPRNRWLLAILLTAQLMVILDITAVNIAMPSIAKDLHIGGASISWTITSYSLIFGSLLLLGGRAADLLGRRRLFLTGLGIFTTSSLLSATAGSAAALFAARAGQGLGASMLSPAALSIITSTFEGEQRAKALAAWGAIGGAGAAIGVLLGGILTQLTDWRTIFFVNLPLAIALAIAATKAIPADIKRPHWKGLDLRGAILATVSIGSIVYAITQAEHAGWTSAQTLIFAGGGITGLGLFAACERRTGQPLLRIERLRDRAIGGGLAICIANAALMFGLFLLCSLYLQLALGSSPLLTGLTFIPLAVAAGSGAHVAGHLINRYGLRRSVSPALALAAGGLLLLSHIPAHGSYLRDMLPGMLMAGFGLELGGTLGIAIYASIATAASGGTFFGATAAAGIAHAFLIAGFVALAAGVAATIVLPAAETFLPKLRLNPEAMAAQ